MNIRTIRRRSVVGVPICLGLLGVSVLVIRPVMQARSLKNDLARMGGNRITETELRRWAKSYDRDTFCDQRGCTVEISNSVLEALRLAPPTRLVAGVSVAGGRVVSTGLTLVCTNRRGRWPKGACTMLVIAYEPPSYFRERLTAPYVGHSPKQNPPTVTYAVTPQFGAKAVELARDISIWCLARVGGCLAGAQQASKVWAMPETPPPGYINEQGTGLFGPRSATAPDR